MKRVSLFFLIFFTNIIFANEIKEVLISVKVNEPQKVCCQRSDSFSNGEIVTVKACVTSTGD